MQPPGGHSHPVRRVDGRVGRLDQPEAEQALRHHRFPGIVRDAVAHTGLDLAHERFLRIADDLVDVALRRAESAVHREGAGHVGRVVGERRRRIDEQQLAVAHDAVVLHVMQHGGVGPRADDASVSRPVPTEPAEGPFEQRLDLVLAAAGRGRLHRLLVRPHADLDGLAEQGDLGGTLLRTQLADRVVERVHHQPGMRDPNLRQGNEHPGSANPPRRSRRSERRERCRRAVRWSRGSRSRYEAARSHGRQSRSLPRGRRPGSGHRPSAPGWRRASERTSSPTRRRSASPSPGRRPSR